MRPFAPWARVPAWVEFPDKQNKLCLILRVFRAPKVALAVGKYLLAALCTAKMARCGLPCERCVHKRAVHSSAPYIKARERVNAVRWFTHSDPHRREAVNV